VIVRGATPLDVPAMLELGKHVIEKSTKARYAFDSAGAIRMATRCMSEENACLFVADHEGLIVAILAGAIQRWPYLDARFATDFLFASVRPGAGRALLRRFITWAHERDADEVVVTVGFGGKSAMKDRLYEREGFVRMGSRFNLDLRTSTHVR
jgi:GNAT superfamily N-acetyltransferase